MQIILKTSGRISPIGLSKELVRLCVETCGIDKIVSYTFELFTRNKAGEIGELLFSQTDEAPYAYIDESLLSDRTEYVWRASCNLKNGAKIHSSLATFETGISSGGFIGKWIENPLFDGSVGDFEKSFVLPHGIEKARLYIVGLGFYKSMLNGTPTDDYFFKPLLTDFDVRKGLNNKHYNEENFDNGKKSVCYETFDVTELLRPGKNILRVSVGTGWYCNTDKDITDPSYTFGTPKLLFELRVHTSSGEIIVYSDETCEVRNTNFFSQMYAGDKFDFFSNEKEYIFARVCSAPRARLQSGEGENDLVIEKIKPIKKKKLGKNFWEYDFGKNHTGSLDFWVKGTKGSKLTVRFYETKKDGVLNPHTSRWLAYKDGDSVVGYLDQESEYVLSGGIDHIQPLFHWNGYRFATIESDFSFQIREICSLFISTGVEQDGGFFCSDAFLNRLQNVFLLTQRSNMHCGVPSDCPHREKLPYTGDGHLAAESTMYNLATENFYRKWLKDILASQGNNGFVPYTAPHIAGGGGFWWSNALVVLPWLLYGSTGDKQILKDCLPALKNLVEYYLKESGDSGIVEKGYLAWFLGDWLAPEMPMLDVSFANTLAVYYALFQTEKICNILGETKEAMRLSKEKERIAKAFNGRFFDQSNGEYCKGVQGANVLPLLFGIVEEEYREAVEKKVIQRYENDTHFDTGIVFTPKLLELLTVLDRNDLAYRLLTVKTAPSFYAMLQGETTFCEHWNKYWPSDPTLNVSHSHPMFGSVLAWIYKNVAGLNLENLSGKKIIYAPKLIREVKSASAFKKTQYGLASIAYQGKRNFKMTIEVPFNCKGLVELPSYVKSIKINGEKIADEKEKVFSLECGKHHIIGKMNCLKQRGGMSFIKYGRNAKN